MTMIQAHKRTKTYVHAFPDVTLKFAPNELGHVVCDVEDQSAVDRLLATPTGFRLYGDQIPAPSPVLTAEVPAADLSGESPYLLVSGESTFDLRPLDDDALRAFAKSNGIKVHHAAKGDTIRDAIVAAVNTPE